MADSMQEKVLFNVLQEISRGGSGMNAAPDHAYLKALETIGYINTGWDNSLTSWGSSVLRSFQNARW